MKTLLVCMFCSYSWHCFSRMAFCVCNGTVQLEHSLLDSGALLSIHGNRWSISDLCYDQKYGKEETVIVIRVYFRF